MKIFAILAFSVSLFGQTLQQTLDSGQRYVSTPPGIIQGPITITTSGQTVDFSASTVQCPDADCIIVGNPANYNATSDVTLTNPRGVPTISGGQHSFIAVYGQKTRIYNVTTARGAGNFGHIITVIGDQAFTLDGLNNDDSTFYCNLTFCGSAVYAPGPFLPNAALGWLSHLQIHPECGGNGVDWQSGNTVVIRDSVIQGFSQFAVRAGIRHGGYGGTELDNVYMETGCHSNPLGNVGSAGLIAQGGAVTIHSDRQPHGDSPRFANTGSTYWLYFVTMNRQPGPYGTLFQVAGGWSLDSVPLFLGDALSDNATPINGQFPVVPGAAVYRVLRVPMTYHQDPLNSNGWLPNPVATPPQGTGNWLVATVQASSCTSICEFTDAMTAPQPYTTENPTQPNRDATYYPDFQFWPGDLVLTYGATVLANEPLGAGNRYTIVNPWRPGN